MMRAQASSLPFTPVFAALVAIVNTKLPQVGELVLIRLIAQFRRAYKRNDKVGLLIGPPEWTIDLTRCRPSVMRLRPLLHTSVISMSHTRLSLYRFYFSA